MATAPIVDGFTQDVITLMSVAGSFNDKLRKAVGNQEPEVRAEFLRDTLMVTLSPIMQIMPPFVQSIMVRAIVDSVDWKAVVERLLTIPENN
jgi:hypothetical protein